MYSPLFVTLMGIGTVFFGLICIIVLTTIMGSVLKSNAKPAAPAPAAAPKAAAPAAPAVNTAKEQEILAAVIAAVPASADGNWGLSFQQEGKPPIANATADELKQYHAWYADLSGEKVLYLTFDAGYENGNTPAILDALKKHHICRVPIRQ